MRFCHSEAFCETKIIVKFCQKRKLTKLFSLPFACEATVISLAGILTNKSYRSVLEEIALFLHPAI